MLFRRFAVRFIALAVLAGTAGCFQGGGASPAGMSANDSGVDTFEAEGVSRGGVVSSAIDTDGFTECEMDPTLEKCKPTTSASTPLTECVGGKPAVRLVYRALSPDADFITPPCAHQYPEAIDAYVQNVLEADNLTDYAYADFCYATDEQGAVASFNAAVPVFMGFYFQKPAAAPLQLTPKTLQTRDELADILADADKDGAVFRFKIQTGDAGPMLLPSNKYEDCSVYQKQELPAPVQPLFVPHLPYKLDFKPTY